MTNETEKLSVEIPFSGFYETSHNAMFDDWLEYENETLASEHDATGEQLNELAEKFYSGVNWQAAHVQYAKEYCEALCSMVKDESREYLTDESDQRYLSKGLALTIDFEEMTSPRFYNYENDRIYGKIAIEHLQAMLAAIPSDDWKAWVEKNCASYDGFISHYSNDASAWPDDLREWGEAGLGLLMQCYLIHILGGADKAREALSWGIMEDARGNGFIDDCIWGNANSDFKEYADSLRKDAA